MGGTTAPAKSSMSLALGSLSITWGVECLPNRIFPVLRVLKTSSKYLGGNRSTSPPWKGSLDSLRRLGARRGRKYRGQSGLGLLVGKEEGGTGSGEEGAPRRDVFSPPGSRDGARIRMESVWGGAEPASGPRRCGRPRARDLTSGEPLELSGPQFPRLGDEG